MRIVSVGVDGDVSTFSPELLGFQDPRYGGFTFGNIVQDEVHSIIERVLSSRLHADIEAGVAACARDCAWFGLCRGGSPANKLFEHGSFAVSATLYCRLVRQSVLDVVLQMLEAELDFPVNTAAAA
jgi:uncharacterized protein